MAPGRLRPPYTTHSPPEVRVIRFPGRPSLGGHTWDRVRLQGEMIWEEPWKAGNLISSIPGARFLSSPSLSLTTTYLHYRAHSLAFTNPPLPSISSEKPFPSLLTFPKRKFSWKANPRNVGEIKKTFRSNRSLGCLYSFPFTIPDWNLLLMEILIAQDAVSHRLELIALPQKMSLKG